MSGLAVRRWLSRAGRPSVLSLSPVTGLRSLSSAGNPPDPKALFSPTLLNRAASRGAAKLTPVLDALRMGKFDPKYEFAPGTSVKQHLQARRCQEALTNAARFGDLDIVKQLIESGVDIESSTKDGSTTLLCGIQSSKAVLVKYLLEKGARVAVINNRGQTPRSLASHYLQDEELVRRMESLEAAQTSNLPFPDACALFLRSTAFLPLSQDNATADTVHIDPRFLTPLSEDLQAQRGSPMDKILPRAVDLVNPEAHKQRQQEKLRLIHLEEATHRQRMQEQRMHREQQQVEKQLRQEWKQEIPRLRERGLISSTSTLQPTATINPSAKATRLTGCIMDRKPTSYGLELTLSPVCRAWGEHPWSDPSFTREGSVVVRVEVVGLVDLPLKTRDAFLSYLLPGRLVDVHGHILAAMSTPNANPFQLTIAAKSITAFMYTARGNSIITQMMSSSHATLVDMESNCQPPTLSAICSHRQARLVVHVHSNASIESFASTMHQLVQLASQPSKESPPGYQPWVVGVDAKWRSSFYDAPDFTSKDLEEEFAEGEWEEGSEGEAEGGEVGEEDYYEEVVVEEEGEDLDAVEPIPPSSLPSTREFVPTEFLQIATRMGIFVIDMSLLNSRAISIDARKQLLSSLHQLFTCKHIYKVGVDIHPMLQRLADSFGQQAPELLQCSRAVDLLRLHSLLSNSLNNQPSTLSELFYTHFQRSIDDMVNLSTPWHVRPAEEDAIDFAGLCAGAKLKLYDHMVTQLLSKHDNVDHLLCENNVVTDIKLAPNPNLQS